MVTPESYGDSTQLLYLRARYYNPTNGRIQSRDTWVGDVNNPMSFNRWNYVQSNPINYVDPTGQRAWCPWWWNEWAVKWRGDVAEKYVSQTSDPMDTYTAAGIAIQCAGTNFNTSFHYSGEGIAQITDKQAETESGEPIYEYYFWGVQKYEMENGHIKLDKKGNPIPVIRGYGLRLRCPDGELEKILNQNNTKNAVILMKKEIQLVTGACGNNCTATDIYIAAALAQNGPGFTYKDIQGLRKITAENSKKYGNPDVVKDWFYLFGEDAKDHDMVNTKTQLNRFILVVNELRKRRWIVPYIDTTVIDTLKNWQE